MRRTLFLLSIFLCSSAVLANSGIFENNNPFPQTMPQSLNNIYESEPAYIMHEEKQEKKSWFKRGKNIQEQDLNNSQTKSSPVYPPNENNNGNFYIFK